VRTRAVGRKSIQTKQVEELPAKLSAGLRGLVVPYLKEEGLPVPAAWGGGEAVSDAPADAPAASDETVAAVEPGGDGVSGADGGAGFAILPWSIAGGGLVVATVGLGAAAVSVILPFVLAGTFREQAINAAQSGNLAGYEQAETMFNALYILLYGGTSLGALLVLGGVGMVAGGSGWALMGGE
jgi:hypothetical protein